MSDQPAVSIAVIIKIDMASLAALTPAQAKAVLEGIAKMVAPNCTPRSRV